MAILNGDHEHVQTLFKFSKVSIFPRNHYPNHVIYLVYLAVSSGNFI